MKLLIAIMVALFAGSAASAAEAGSRNWAACVWATDPEAAQAWLAGTDPKWQTKPEATELVIGMRLVALCSDVAADELKVNREPKWSRLRSALKKADRAAALAPSNAEALMCRNYIEGTLYLHEFVRRVGSSETIVHRQYFTDLGGQPVKLPQDLRSLPGEGMTTSRECSIISSTGELQPLKDETNA